MRKAPSFLLLSVAVPGLTALPVLTAPAATPEPVAPQVRAVALAGVNGDALDSVAATKSLAVSKVARTDVAAQDRGRAPGRPAVLTAARESADFDLLGVTWERGPAAAEPDLTVLVRTHGKHGWSGWTALDPAPRPDRQEGTHLRAGTEPLWAGSSDGYQVRVDLRSGTLPRDLKVDLINPGDSDADEAVGTAVPAASAAAATAKPTIYTRKQWGADERLRSGSPNYTSTIKTGFVHHTVGSNGYASADVPKILRGVYAYHTRSNGWSDVGYNFFVDRFGRIWEGRAGGITKAVLGAHTGGFNSQTFGVSAIGNYETVAPTTAMLNGIARVMAWKLSLYYRNPVAKSSLTSSGGGTSRYPSGRAATFNVVSGHRDAGYTACPGKYLYAKLSTIRAKTLAYLGAGLVAPSASATSTAVTVKAGVTHAGQTWRAQLRDAETGYPIRSLTGAGAVSATVPLIDDTGYPLPGGRYDVVVDSWAGGASARPFAKTVSVAGTAQTDAVRLADGSYVLALRTSSGGLEVLTKQADGRTVARRALEAAVVGRPTIGIDGHGRIVVATRGTNGYVYVKRRSTAGVWPSVWERVGAATGPPALVATGSALTVLARGPKGDLLSWTSGYVGRWATPRAEGGQLARGTSVGAVRTPDGILHVMTHGVDDHAWYHRQTAGRWDPTWTNLGGVLRGDVDLASTSFSGVIASSWGTTDRPYSLRLTAGSRGSWQRVGSIRTATAPALADRAGGSSASMVARRSDRVLNLTSLASGAVRWWPIP